VQRDGGVSLARALRSSRTATLAGILVGPLAAGVYLPGAIVTVLSPTSAPSIDSVIPVLGSHHETLGPERGQAVEP